MTQSDMNNVGTGTQEEMFQAGLETIRINFIHTLGPRLAEIKQNMHAIETNTDAHAALMALMASSHKFRGTAKTLGFTALGTVAGDLEDCIKDFENPEKETAQVARKFLGFYADLVEEISILAA